MVGLDSPKTIKFTRVIGGKQVLVLLDSGATHNFISDRLINELQVSVQPTTFVVVLGDNKKVSGVGECRKVKLMVQGMKIIQDFLSNFEG